MAAANVYTLKNGQRLAVVYDPILKFYYLHDVNSTRPAYNGLVFNEYIDAVCEIIRLDMLYKADN